jgi:NAD(P)H-flavin reductase
MYRFVLMKLFERGVSADRIIVSLERMMKCGVGKCGHCAEKHIYICMDGPVFNYGAIKDIEGLL